MKALLTVALCVICAAAFAVSGLYYVKFDTDGYIVDITSETGDPQFVRINFMVEIPEDILSKSYKYIDGQFVLDQDKYAEWLSTRSEPAITSPDAIGGGE